MANVITCIRILCAFALLFCPVLTPVFWVLYLTAGITDMFDGAVARKTNTVTEFGSLLDTAADLALTAVCLIRLAPVLELPAWIWIWTAVIALLKIMSALRGVILNKKVTAVHSALNKATGLLLFVCPMTLSFLDIRYSAAVICVLATAAAVQEWLVTGKV